MKIDPEILKRLDALATKLGVTADHLWGVLVAQARVEFIVDAGLLAFWAMAFFLAMRFAKQVYRSGVDADASLPAFLLLCGIAIVAGFATLYFASELPGLIMNPEFWALKQVLEVAK